MTKKILLGALLFCSWGFVTFGQNVYQVYLKDKPKVNFNPYVFFDPNAIERRECMGISLYDETDLPVSGNYLQQISDCSEEIIGKSRWFNLIVARIPDHRLEEVKALPFVSKIEPSPQMALQVSSAPLPYAPPDENLLTSIIRYQTDRLKGNIFRDKNLTGKGVRIAVLDVGFSGANIAPELEHLFKNNQIIDKKDFVSKKEFEFIGGWHGTAVISCIAGNYQGLPMGLAPNAEFLLARTEYEKKEPFVEEIFWTEAAEWADQKGAHLINSSLGYGDTRYTYKDMDGKTSLVARSANKAVSRGILVLVAQGNEGTDAWEFLGTPADADSVLSIGGTNPFTDYHINFSSWGPTYDRRLKPNLSAPAHTGIRTDKMVKSEFGTSFSTPLVCGFAACVKELHPKKTERELFAEMQKSGHLYPYFDYAHGYGIPQADYFFNPPVKKSTFKFDVQGDQILVRLNQKPDNTKTTYVYYAIENEKGTLDHFSVVNAESELVLVLEKSALIYPNYKLRVHYEGFTDIYIRKED